MKKEKGFTLIELLAVIVLLAILMVIAVPKILNVIENSRKSAAESSIKLVKDAIKTQVTSESMMGISFTSNDDGCYTFNFDDQNSGNAKALQLKNKEKITGTIKYCNGNFSDDSLKFDGTEMVKNCQYKKGKTFEFDYSGKEDTFVTPCDGIYKFETWGAQGGSYSDTYQGGYGGYSKGNIKLSKNDILYINVGGNDDNHGYNGGITDSSYDKATIYTSGGATSIATKSGLLADLEKFKDNILIVSGGGGGSFYRNDSNIYINTGSGGSGGGYKGVDAYNRLGQGNGFVFVSNATGGNQISGGNYGQSKHSFSTTMIIGNVGTFGKGGIGYYGGSGGGGYYGGGSGGYTAGAGGSGYIGNLLLIDKLMYCYNCDESSDESTKTISTENVSETPISNYAKKGNGYVKITLIK